MGAVVKSPPHLITGAVAVLVNAGRCHRPRLPTIWAVTTVGRSARSSGGQAGLAARIAKTREWRRAGLLSVTGRGWVDQARRVAMAGSWPPQAAGGGYGMVRCGWGPFALDNVTANPDRQERSYSVTSTRRFGVMTLPLHRGLLNVSTEHPGPLTQPSPTSQAGTMPRPWLPQGDLRPELAAHMLKEVEHYPGRANRGLPRSPLAP